MDENNGQGVLDLEFSEWIKKIKNGSLSVAVIGLGRIGLPTAVTIAQAGLATVGADINADIVKSVNSGKLVVNDEPGLKDVLHKVAVESKKFTASTEIGAAVRDADVVVVCLPTPLDYDSKKTDYQFLLDGCAEIAKHMRRQSLIVIESTVGPNIVEDKVIPVLEKHSGMAAGKDFGVAACPERANPSTIMTDFGNIPRIIGSINQKCTDFAVYLYEFVFNTSIIPVSDCKTANAIKVVENVFRDVNVAFINEMAIFCDRMGIDVNELIKGCNTKYNFIPHFPGPGVGGPCLPVNPYQLLDAPEAEDILQIVRAAREVNTQMPSYVIGILTDSLKEIDKNHADVTVGVLGISYKPNVADVQLTPIREIVKRLQDMNVKGIKIFDPFFINTEFSGVRTEGSLELLVRDCDVLILGTDHDEFLKLDYKMIKGLMRQQGIIIDTRGKLSYSDIRDAGLIFQGIGRQG